MPNDSPPHAAPAPAFVVLHADARLTLATDTLLLPPEQASALSDALALARKLADLHEEADGRVRAAVEAGRTQGHAEGLALGHAQGLQLAATALADTVQQLQARAIVQADDLQQQVVSLSLLVVRRIAGELAPEAVLSALARQAFEHVAASATDPTASWQHCQLRVNPGLLPAMQQHVADIGPALKVLPDDGLATLDCTLDTPGGRLLAGLESQLARIQASLARPPAQVGAEAATTS